MEASSDSKAFALSWIEWYILDAVEMASALESGGPRFELELNYSLVICHWEFLKSVLSCFL